MKVVQPFLRTAFNYDRDKASDDSGLDCSGDEGFTQQSFAEECDINTLVRRFGLGADLPVGAAAPTYGDFTGVDDYQSALNAIIFADEQFMLMPAEVRARFHNSAAEFVDFCSDDKNRDEAAKLGLLVPQAASLVKQNVAGGDIKAPPAPVPEVPAK